VHWENKKLIEKEEVLLALDIGSEYVKALAFCIDDKQNKIKIKYKKKGSQNSKNMAGGAISNVDDIAKVCQKVINKIEKKLKTKISKVIIGFAGRSIKGGTMRLKYERLNAKLKINASELENIIQKTQWKIFDKFRRDFLGDEKRLASDLKIIDGQILRIFLDGREIFDPIGLQGKNITFEILNSVSSSKHFEDIKNVVKRFNFKNKRVVCEPCAIANLSRLCIENMEKRTLFIDVGGSSTDIASLKDGEINNVSFFPFGGRIFSYKISQEFKISNYAAENIKIKYSNGNLGKHIALKIKNMLKQDMKVWNKGVKIALEEISRNNFSPSAIYLCGGGCLLPEIKQSLQTMAIGFRRSYLNVRFLPPHLFYGKIIDEEKAVKDLGDITLLGLAGIELNKQDNFIKQSLNRAIRLIQGDINIGK